MLKDGIGFLSQDQEVQYKSEIYLMLLTLILRIIILVIHFKLL
jgi:hypothetical protein